MSRFHLPPDVLETMDRAHDGAEAGVCKSPRAWDMAEGDPYFRERRLNSMNNAVATLKALGYRIEKP